MNNKTAPLMIVLSRNYSTGLGIIRALGAAGYKVDLIASVKKKGSSVIASSSKYVNKCVEVLSPDIQNDDGSGILAVLKAYSLTQQEKMVLFPADDFTASIVFSNRDELKEHFLMPGISDNTTAEEFKLMDKMYQSSCAKNAGLFTPMEWKISLETEIIIPHDVIYPCFVKPLQSIHGSKNEMKMCNSEVDLELHLQKMKQNFSNRSVLIQEYLNIEKEYDLSGVVLRDKIIIPGIIEKKRISKHEKGVTMVGKMMSPEKFEKLMENIEMFLGMFQYSGMFDMEFNVCGDKIYFNEINFRSGGPNYSYYLNGVNLPQIFVEWLMGQDVDHQEVKIKEFGKTFVYEKVAWEDYIYSHMTKAELDRCINEADYTLLKDDSDPKPGQIFARRIRLSAMKQRVKKILGK